MTLRQLAKNRMFKNVLEFLAASMAAFTGFTRLLTEITKLNALNETLDKHIQEQAQETSGVTGGKNTTMDDLIALTVKASRKAFVYAKDEEDEELMAIFNVQKTTFDHIPEATALGKIEDIYDALTPIATPLLGYKVTPADLTAISDGIDKFKDEEGEPGVARSEKQAGTQGIDETMDKMDDSLEIMDDLIIHGIDDADVVNNYRNNRTEEVVGTRHTGLKGTFNDAVTGLGIENGTLTNRELEKTAQTNILGVATIPTMKPGIYHFEFSAPGYITQVLIIKIVRGETLVVRSFLCLAHLAPSI